jgi:hypothetical protein
MQLEGGGMARLRRRWRAAKWAGLVRSVLIAVAWASSLLLNIHYQDTSRGWAATLWRGMIMASHDLGWPDGWRITVAPIRPMWRVPGPDYVREDPNGGGLPEWSPVRFSYIRLQRLFWWLYLPLWAPFVLAALLTAVLFGLDRHRIPPHCCQGCGYDLTGNTSGVCPECGKRKANSHRQGRWLQME